MSMQQGFLVLSGSMRAPPRAKPPARLVEAPENRRNHPASTRIGESYGESRTIWGIPVQSNSKSLISAVPSAP